MATNAPRAIGYIRRSSHIDMDPGMSWQLQEDAVRALAARYGVKDLEVASDWGKSGGYAKRHLRPSWMDLHRRIEAGEVQLVFGYAADRMSRSLLDLLEFYRACEKAGAKVVYHDGGEQDFRSPEGTLRLQMMGSISEFQRAQTVEKMKASHRIRRERGERVGRVPYGSQPGDQVERVIATYRQVGSITGTARRLNDEGVPTATASTWKATTARPRPPTWSTQTVRLVLEREAPGLLPRATRQGARPVSTKGFALYHLLWCACGQTLTAARPTIGDVIYRCQRAERDPRHSRPYRVREATLMPWIKSEAARFRVPGDVLELDTANETRRAALAARREHVLDMREAGQINREETTRRLDAIAEALDMLDTVRTVVDIPAGVDWEHWSAETINRVLRGYWQVVELNEQMEPVRAHWLVPPEYVA